ncbi:hypothetical protein HUX88_09440 [Duganella sp. BJB1802]|uniref:hypothetical protein n=1 Tax=Duganella sp. BJB1802 TaxID=2744575 RepID=UPI001593033E|nr:hypothetical protein [Duganella sp. BJB1802]NVD70784.1 hypothetical protein [Duganella sp. BJB1802]
MYFLGSKFICLLSLIPFKDIAVNAFGSLIGGFVLLWLTVGLKGIKSIRARFGRPSIEIEVARAPSNIFSAIKLGSSADWIKQQFGHPAQVSEGWWGYNFQDALVTLEFDSQMAVQTIAVALVDEKTTFNFPTIHFDCPPLGKAVLSDAIVEHLNLEYVESTRHSELLVSGREGPRGAWHYITLGVLWPHFPGRLLEVEFEWNKDDNSLTTPPSDVKINWVAISRNSGPAHFRWDLGLNLQ